MHGQASSSGTGASPWTVVSVSTAARTPIQVTDQHRSASTAPLNPYGAYIIGFSSVGEPLVHFPDNNHRPTPPEGAQMLDFDPVTGAAIVKYPAVQTTRVSIEDIPQAIASDSQIQKEVVSVEEQQQSPLSRSSGGVTQSLYQSSWILH